MTKTNGNYILEGKKTAIRFFEETDLPLLFKAGISVRESGDYWLLSEVKTQQALWESFKKCGFYSEGGGRLAIVEKTSGEVIGIAIFYTPVYFKKTTLEVGYRIFDQKNWGKGFASEAITLLTAFLFESRCIGRVQIHTDVENQPAIRLAEKCGFKKEGILKNSSYCRGRYCDQVLYAITSEDRPKIKNLNF